MSRTALIILVVVGVFALGIGACVFVFWGLFSGPVNAADTFLEQVAAGDFNTAYAESAPAFRSSVSQDGFVASAQQLGLTRYASSSWSSRNISGNTATLEGSIRTTDNATIPLRVELVQEGDTWRVVGIFPQAGTSPAGLSPPASGNGAAPSNAEVQRLVENALLSFNRALQAGGDFSGFYAELHPSFQQSITPDGIRQAFQQFVDRGYNFSPIVSLTPVFDPAPTVQDGVLSAQGYYEYQGDRLRFTINYQQDGALWKPIGVNLTTGSGASDPSMQMGQPTAPQPQPAAPVK